MVVFLNGQFVPEGEAKVSVFDRSFLYGDGLFETLRIFNGKPFRWRQHWERLERGAQFLKIPLSFASDTLREAVLQLVARNRMRDALLRLTLSRGVGVRGYSPKGADHPIVVMSLHPAPSIDPQNPPRWKLITSSHRLPANELLAQFKSCNKLAQILARAEADAAGADEALLLNTDGFVVEGASSNLFWIENETVCTPALASGILPGVTRATIVELCAALKLKTCEGEVIPEELQQKKGVFVSLSSYGPVEAVTLDGHGLAHSPLVETIAQAYDHLIRIETA